MTFKDLERWYENEFTLKITKEDLSKNSPDLIAIIKNLKDTNHELKNSTIEVLSGMEYYLNYGSMPHKITKDKLKKVTDVFEKMGKLESNTEDQKRFIAVFAYCVKDKLEEWDKPKDKYKKQW